MYMYILHVTCDNTWLSRTVTYNYRPLVPFTHQTSVLVPAVSQCSAHVQLWRLYQTGAVGISSVQHLASSKSTLYMYMYTLYCMHLSVSYFWRLLPYSVSL